MKITKYRKLIVTAALLLVISVLGTVTISQSYAQGGGVQRQSAATGTAFTYQGQLVYNGTPVNGTCDLTFRLYDSVGNGATQIGFNQQASSTTVSDGFFTVSLDFGSDAFSGDARYLQIAINSCTNGASNVTLPSIELTAAPYALGLRPGAVISGSVTGGSSLKVVNSDNSTSYGIYAQTDSNTNSSAGIYGTASSTSAKVYGVYGAVSSSDSSSAGVEGFSSTGSASGVEGITTGNNGVGVYGISYNDGNGVIGTTYGTSNYISGVYGRAFGSTGVTFGVRGEIASNSDGAAGVYGYTSSISGTIYGILGETSSTSTGAAGVKGETTATSGTPYGVYGIASDTGAVTSYGVYGESKSSAGTGVGGVAPSNGVYGEASGTSGTTWGVYGKSDSPDGYGVYSNGNAHVEGALTWKAITGTISVPAAAFAPQYNYTAQAYNSGSIVRTLDGSPDLLFNAPVQLPHGATVTGMTIYWRDDYAAGDGTVNLYRSNFQLIPISMATASTTGSGGDGNSSDLTISYNPIDNSSFTYYLSARLPYESGGSTYVGLYGVVIEYTITQPY